MKILGYLATEHFLDQMRVRGIDAMLVSLCLAKGKVKGFSRKGRILISLHKEELMAAISAGYLPLESVHCALEFIVVVKERRLITAYLRRGDVGI